MFLHYVISDRADDGALAWVGRIGQVVAGGGASPVVGKIGILTHPIPSIL